MTRYDSRSSLFKVIDGGAIEPPARPALRIPPPPRLAPSELAADMAEIYATSLLRDVPLDALDDPHHTVRLDGTTKFTLHELLCELRTLTWFDGRGAAEIQDHAALSSRACLGEPGHRRSLRVNGDGQLTLRTLFRSGVALTGESALASAFWRSDFAACQPDPGPEQPASDAPMSAWLDWCERQSGASLRVPGAGHRPQTPQTLGQMADALHGLPPARPFHNAALAALARGAAQDPGLEPARGLWRGARLLSLMAEAEARACRMTLAQAGRPDRLPRPAVTAARMTVWLAREERELEPRKPAYRAAAEELAQSAPGLLHWVSRANAQLRGPQRFDNALFLPLVSCDDRMTMPSDCAPHAAVAGALATLIKAVFDSTRRSRIQIIGTGGPELALGEEADRMAANLALARVVSGGYHPAENFQDLRLGQAIALQVLRDAAERDNRSVSLSFTDFDGREMQINAHPRRFGRGFAELRVNGAAVPWPEETTAPAAHLTAVV